MTVEASDTVNPAQVYALVVGIERYPALGEEWDLPGPANDALQFARWLLKRQVKTENIKLFLSPLDSNSEVYETSEEWGLDPQRATLKNIQTAVYDLQHQEASGKRLYVFWAGHGFITTVEHRTRHLLGQDTDLKTRENLSLDSLVQALKTATRSTLFEKQVFFIDACANPIFHNFYETVSAKEAAKGLGINGEEAIGEQSCLFSAAEYEVAINDAEVGAGRFSQAVLAELKALPLFSDMKVLAESVKLRCRETGQSEPVYLDFQVGEDREVVDNIQTTIINSPSSRQPDATKCDFEDRSVTQGKTRREYYSRRLAAKQEELAVLEEDLESKLGSDDQLRTERKIEKILQAIDDLEMKLKQEDKR